MDREINGLTNGLAVYWSVQVANTAFAAGPFATETSVVTIRTLTLTPSTIADTIASWTPPTFSWHLGEMPALTPVAWAISSRGEAN